MIDASIPLAAQTPQYESPLQAYAKALAVKNALAQGQLQQLEIQRAQIENQQRLGDLNAYRNLYGVGGSASATTPTLAPVTAPAEAPAPGLPVSPDGSALPSAPAYVPRSVVVDNDGALTAGGVTPVMSGARNVLSALALGPNLAGLKNPFAAGVPIIPQDQAAALAGVPPSPLGTSPTAAAVPASPLGTSPAAAAVPASPLGTSPAVPVEQRPAVPTVADLLRRGFSPATAQALAAHFQEAAKNAAEIDKAKQEADKASKEANGLVLQHLAQTASGLVDFADKDNGQLPSDLVQWHLQNFASLGPEEQKEASSVAQHLANLSPADQVAFLRTLTATPQMMEAGAKQTEAQTGANRFAQEKLEKQRQTFLSVVGAIDPKAPDAQAQYSALLKATNPDVLRSTGAPMQFSPAAQTSLVRGGQTANEQVTADQTAKRDANTARNEADRNRQTANYQNAELGIRRAELDMNRVSADPFGLLGINQHPIGGGAAGVGSNLHGQEFLQQLPPQLQGTVRAIAEGRQTDLPRDGKSLDQLMGLVNQYDPTYSKQRGQMRTAYVTGPQGRNIGNLNTAVVHLDQLHEVMKAMNNGSFVPGNQLYNWVAEKMGSANVTNPDFVVQSFAGEAANALKGNATDPEIAHILKTLSKDRSPAQLEGGSLAGLHLLGAKLNTYDEQYHQLSPDDPWTPVLPSARKVFQRYGIQPLSRIGQADNPSPAGTEADVTATQRKAAPGAPAAAAAPAAVPAAKPGQLPPLASGMVRMKAPDGSIADVPAGMASHYEQKGARRF